MQSPQAAVSVVSLSLRRRLGLCGRVLTALTRLRPAKTRRERASPSGSAAFSRFPRPLLPPWSTLPPRLPALRPARHRQDLAGLRYRCEVWHIYLRREPDRDERPHAEECDELGPRELNHPFRGHRLHEGGKPPARPARVQTSEGRNRYGRCEHRLRAQRRHAVGIAQCARWIPRAL